MNVAQAVECVEKNRDMIVGIKVRLTADAANDGRNEAEGLRYSYLPFMDNDISVPL